jgi:hypothetical protein
MTLAGTVFSLLLLSPGFQAPAESTVGVPGTIRELVLPGPELEALPVDAKSPIVLRVLSVAPHGALHRYDLEFTGLEPGDHDLRAYLRRRDGTSTSDLTPIPITVRSLLPPGRVTPHPPAPGSSTSFGGYGTVLVVGGAAWILGLAGLLFARRRHVHGRLDEAKRPKTLADRLRPLVEQAIDGTLSREERAKLELSLVEFWRRKLGLEEHRTEDAIVEMRRHADAGPLLEGLETWLHEPPRSDGERARIDLGRLLAPYRDLPPDALDLAGQRAR